MNQQTRLTVYITGAFGAMAALAALMGWATYDSTTNLVDIAPFNVVWLGTQVATWVAPPLAWIAVKMGWGRR